MVWGGSSWRYAFGIRIGILRPMEPSRIPSMTISVLFWLFFSSDKLHQRARVALLINVEYMAAKPMTAQEWCRLNKGST